MPFAKELEKRTYYVRTTYVLRTYSSYDVRTTYVQYYVLALHRVAAQVPQTHFYTFGCEHHPERVTESAIPSGTV